MAEGGVVNIVTIEELKKISVKSKMPGTISSDSAGQEVCMNKARYETKEQAMMAYNSYRRTMQRKRGRRVEKIKHVQLPYKCPFCGLWHLTRK